MMLHHMKIIPVFILVAIMLASCGTESKKDETIRTATPIIGTWKLISGTLIEKGDTSITYYDKNISFIKIINETHFSFLQHDLNKGKDSTAVFAAGGGSYTIKDSLYTEQLEYCSARNWEGNDFPFTVQIKNDTLIQSGVEKVESAGVNRINIEKYVRLK